MRRRGLVRAVVAALTLMLSACQVDVTIDLTVEETGAGTVVVEAVFDAAAAATLGDLQDQLRLRDLGAAGWDTEISLGDAGDVVVSATKQVANRDQWQAVLDELAGRGVFTNVQVSTDDSFAQAQQTLSFDVDLRSGWNLFSDAGVAATLNGEPFGAPIESLTNGRTIDEIVSVAVNASVTSDADAQSGSTSAGIAPRFDADTVRFDLTSSSENTTAVLLRWVSYALFALFALATVLAITGIVLQRRADRLRPAPTPASLASRVPGASATAPGTAAAATGAAPRETSVRLVVVEPLTVLYQQHEAQGNAVLAFVRDQQGTARADTILDGYRSVLSGAMETGSFWELCGVSGNAAPIDQRFVDTRQLRSGAASFLEEMQRRRIPVAATTNDSATWSLMARDRDRLSAVWPWLVSSDVGTTTSNVAMFEVLRRESGVAHGHCLYVDTDIEALDAAKELGMKTALFDLGFVDLPDIVGHPVVTDFRALFGAK